ncbi:MAG: hypothetical protein ACXWKP_16845 [Bradyrhizobium sp.]|jgi:hypothetical protein
MSVSSVPASTYYPPVTPLDANSPKAPAVQADGDANDAGAIPPPVQPALPPGQGTRVNQLV